MRSSLIGTPTQYRIYEDSVKILKESVGLDIPTKIINLEFLSREEFDKKYEGSAPNVWGISETPCAELYLHSVRSEGVVEGTTELIDSRGKRAYKIEVPVDMGIDDLPYRAKLIGHLCRELARVWMWENNVIGKRYIGPLQENHNDGKILEKKICQMNKTLDKIQKIDELVYMRYPFVATADALKDFDKVASLVKLAARSASDSLNVSRIIPQSQKSEKLLDHTPLSKSDSDFGESLKSFFMNEKTQKRLCRLYAKLQRSEFDVMRSARRTVNLRDWIIKLNNKYGGRMDDWSSHIGNIARRQYLRIHRIEELNKSKKKTFRSKKHQYFAWPKYICIYLNRMSMR